MSDLTWPGSLPQQFSWNVQRNLTDAAMRTRMDAGPVKMRPKYTAESVMISVTLIMTGAQYATLDTFYRETSEKGTHPFDWDDPLDNTTKEVRFNGPPRANLRRGEISVPTDALWAVALSLELLPGAPPRVTPGPGLLTFFIPIPTLVFA